VPSRISAGAQWVALSNANHVIIPVMTGLAEPITGCIFCGAEPLTDEHVWPQWIATASPPPKERVHHIRRFPDETAIWRAPAYATNVRVVCASCNAGWMRDLEQSVQPVLAPLLWGERAVLDADSQARLATWALKTAMMFEFTHPDRRTISWQQRRSLFEMKTVPASVQVWIGSYAGDEMNAVYRHTAIVLRPDRFVMSSDHMGDSYGITLGVRRVLFQLWGSTLPDALLENAPDTNRRFPQIAPFRAPCVWPPELLVTEQTLDAALQTFDTQGDRVLRPSKRVLVLRPEKPQ
jgi:hypothetical protein